MRRILSILLIFTVMNFLAGCKDMRNLDPKKQENIEYYQNTIQLFAENNNYNPEFVSNEKLDDYMALEGEIKLEKDRDRIDFAVQKDGTVKTRLFVENKTDLDYYLNYVIELSNSISKRQFTLDQIKDFLDDDSNVYRNDPNYKSEEFGWMMDSLIEYSESDGTASLDIHTGIINLS